MQGADAGGYLVIRKPWPSMLRTIWGDNERYLKTYWETFQNRYYVAGDSAHRDKDGFFWIMGRIDDVLNVAGHRLGTMEIESALVAHPKVAEAAVVGKQHEIKGESVFAFVVLRGDRPTGDKIEAFAKTLRDWVTEQLGAIARPDDILFAENLPRTRSGKIMRRLLRAIARNEDITQDLSTLENPAIIDQLRGGQTPKKTRCRCDGAEENRAKEEGRRKGEASAGEGCARPESGAEKESGREEARAEEESRREEESCCEEEAPTGEEVFAQAAGPRSRRQSRPLTRLSTATKWQATPPSTNRCHTACV